MEQRRDSATAYIILADGFETIEALTPLDVLRRCGVEVTTISLNKTRSVRSSHGVTVEADATMEEFIDNVKILINTLGYKVLVPVPKATDDTVYLYCKGTEANAKGFVSTGGFTVLSGSKISDHTVPSLETQGKGYFNLRNTLIKEEVIKDGVFQKDYEFSAPSAASAVILGHTSNGNVDWKTENGTKLKDL